MADVKINDLDAAASVTDSMQFETDTSGTTAEKVTASQLKTYATADLGTIATQDADDVSITGGAISGITDLAVADGGTGASTASAARSNLSAAASGANSDITSLSGLETDLSVAQGGTGASTAEDARTNLGLGALAVEDTVSTALIGNDAVTYAKIQDVSATDKLLGRSTAGAGVVEEIPCTSFARSILDDANAGAVRTTISAAASGANSDITSLSGLETDLSVAQGGTGASTAEDARANLGLTIGTDVQAWDTNLDDFAGKTAPTGDVVGTSDTQTLTNKTIAAGSNTISGLSESNMTAGADILLDTITVTIDGGGEAITATSSNEERGIYRVPFNCTIKSATLLADASGSIVIDIWKDSYANYPPTDGDSITASAPPTLSSAAKSEDTSLTGWTTNLSVGDVLFFNVDSASTVKKVVLLLKVEKT